MLHHLQENPKATKNNLILIHFFNDLQLLNLHLFTPYFAGLLQLSPSPDKINSDSINVQTIATLALECRFEFPEECSLNELWTSFRVKISLLTSKATPPPKTYKLPLHKPYYTRRVKRAIQRRRQTRTAWKNSKSNSRSAAYPRLRQDQRRSRRILRTERLSFEWKLAN